MMLRVVLERAGHEVIETADGLDALRALHDGRPDLVVLDIEMPRMDGWSALERIRDISDAPVIMLTAHGGETHTVRGLRAGADDYVTKPFARDEFLARVDALLRRATQGSDGALDGSVDSREFGDLVVQVARREVYVDGEPVPLTRIEFDLLEVLTASPRRVVQRHELIERVWGPAWFGDDNVIDVHMSKLRRKLGEDVRAPRYIETVRGVGFRMII